jgi:hypothetical protein
MGLGLRQDDAGGAQRRQDQVDRGGRVGRGRAAAVSASVIAAQAAAMRGQLHLDQATVETLASTAVPISVLPVAVAVHTLALSSQ